MTVSISVGRMVVCDACNDDYTDSDAPGGMVCGSWAICPACEPAWRGYPEKQVRRPAVPWQPFREFIIAYRGADAAITIRPEAEPPC